MNRKNMENETLKERFLGTIFGQAVGDALGLRHGPNSYGRQQWGILHNGGNPDAATPRERRSISVCKALSAGKKK